MTGEVLYHKDIVKSTDQVLQMKKKRADKRVQKEHRKKVQEENKSKKDKAKEDHKIKSGGSRQYTVSDADKKLLADAEIDVDDTPEDDAEYYKDAIGADPDKELFENAVKSTRKRPYIPGFSQNKFAKKPKMDKSGGSKGQSDKKFGNKKGGFKNKSDSSKTKFKGGKKKR